MSNSHTHEPQLLNSMTIATKTDTTSHCIILMILYGHSELPNKDILGWKFDMIAYQLKGIKYI